MSTVADLPLANIVEAWGIERIQDVVNAVQNGALFVAVQNGAGQARVLNGSTVVKSDPDMILDMIRGGREAIYVEASSETASLPDHRPLIVRKGDTVLGLLDDEEYQPPKPQAAQRWVGSGGSDAQEAALSAIKAARETFRHKGIALILDIQPSRVGGDPRLVQDLVDHLLEGALEIIDRNGGGSGVHVTVGQGEAGLWIGVEDSGTQAAVYDMTNLLDETPTDDLVMLGIRRMRDRVKEAGGQMRIVPTRTGTRFMVCLPAPT